MRPLTPRFSSRQLNAQYFIHAHRISASEFLNEALGCDGSPLAAALAVVDRVGVPDLLVTHCDGSTLTTGQETLQ